MPIDSRIYLEQRGSKADLAGAAERGMKMGDMMKKRGEETAWNEGIKGAMTKGADGSMTIDKAKLSDLAQLNPQRTMELQANMNAQDQAGRKMQMEKSINEMDLVARVAGSVKDQPSYEQGIGVLTKAGVDVSGMPKQYDPNFVNRSYAMALTGSERAKQQYDREWKQKEFGLKEQELGIKRDEAAGNKLAKSNEAAANLRKERSGNQVTKATAEVSTAYNKIQAAAKNPSAAGDLSLIFGYMKMLDPGSTVREGEFANAQNAAGLPDRIVNAYNNALKGERLNPNQRNDFISQAGNIYKSQMSIQDQLDKTWGGEAEKAGIDPKRVLMNLNSQNPESGAPQVFKTNQIEWAE